MLILGLNGLKIKHEDIVSTGDWMKTTVLQFMLEAP